MNNLAHIVRQFSRQTIMGLEPLGNGLINDTFLVTTEASRFVLQRVNRRVFPKPELITANLLMLNFHVKDKSSVLMLPEVLSTHAGEAWYFDGDGDFWRSQSFIADTESLERITSLADARQVGLALGRFHRVFSDLDTGFLHDTLPGFHIAPEYLSRYRQVAAATPLHDRYCNDFIERFAGLADVLEHAKQQGLLPVRVIHGDPKLNNFLFDRQTGRVAGLIDLDTVKPGLVHYDIGDCLRSCCHREDADNFDLELCAAILESYLMEAGHFFTGSDYDFLYPAIRLLPFELGLRFYTDYLEDNRYFKVSEPQQNLQRATRQFRLCASIMEQEAEIMVLLERLRPGE